MAAMIGTFQDAYVCHHMEKTRVAGVRSLSNMKQDLVMSNDQRRR
jgi:hypothetical protein